MGMPWIKLMVLNAINQLVKELHGYSIEDGTFFNDTDTIKAMYGIDMTK